MTELLAKIWHNPFEYACGAMLVIWAVSLIIKFGKEQWEEIIKH